MSDTRPLTPAERGSLGGRKAADRMSAEERRERARKAGRAARATMTDVEWSEFCRRAAGKRHERSKTATSGGSAERS